MPQLSFEVGIGPASGTAWRPRPNSTKPINKGRIGLRVPRRPHRGAGQSLQHAAATTRIPGSTARRSATSRPRRRTKKMAPRSKTRRAVPPRGSRRAAVPVTSSRRRTCSAGRSVVPTRPRPVPWVHAAADGTGKGGVHLTRPPLKASRCIACASVQRGHPGIADASPETRPFYAEFSDLRLRCWPLQRQRPVKPPSWAMRNRCR